MAVGQLSESACEARTWPRPKACELFTTTKGRPLITRAGRDKYLLPQEFCAGAILN